MVYVGQFFGFYNDLIGIGKLVQQCHYRVSVEPLLVELGKVRFAPDFFELGMLYDSLKQRLLLSR